MPIDCRPKARRKILMKPLIKLILIAAFIIVILTGIFSACGKLSNKITIRATYWGDLKEIAVITDTVKRFKEQNPGIEVHLERYPAGDPYIEKLLTMIAGGAPPDVMFINAEQYINFVESGTLMPLNDNIKKDNFNIGKYYKKIVDKYTIDGKIYAIPRDIAPVCVVYYNKKLFDDAKVKYPTNNWNWNDMAVKAEKLTKFNKDGLMTQYGFADDWNAWDVFVLCNGGSMVDDVKKPTKCVLDSKAAMDGIQFRKDLMYKYKVTPSPSNLSAMGGVGSADLFMQGKVAMFFSGIWKTPMFRDIKNFEWDVVMFPKNPQGKRAFAMSGSGYAVLKTTKHPDEAWKLVSYLAGEQGETELAQTGLAQPAIMSIAESKNFLDGQDPKSKAFLLDAVNYGVFWPDYPRWTEALNAYIFPALDKVWSGDKDAKDVVPDMVKKINENLFNKK
jgi:multiple sugar transport system substrate-binding protein